MSKTERIDQTRFTMKLIEYSNQNVRAKIRPNSLTNALLVLLISVGWITDHYGEDENEAKVESQTNSKGETFTLMDVDAMVSYRNERKAALEESLGRSKLSVEHQDLIANAMAKAFVGIPLSSYTETSRQEQLNEESTESSDNWTIKEDGHLHHEVVPFFPGSVTTESPFVFLHPVPFLPETGTLLVSRANEVTFEFDADSSKIENVGESALADFPLQSSLMFEVIVDKTEQTPKRITLKLKKPIRLPMIFSIKTVSLQYDYSFVENCDCFAINRSTTHIDASMIFRGRLFISKESTYDNVVCDQPLQFLLPDVE